MFDDDIEEIEATCPKCCHHPIKRKDCDNLGCNEGYCDEYDDDPINFPQEGECIYKCSECKGTGAVIWCPSCGADLTGMKIEWDEADF